MMEVRNGLFFFFNYAKSEWNEVGSAAWRPSADLHSLSLMAQYSESAIQVTSSGQFLMRQVETEKSFLITFGI